MNAHDKGLVKAAQLSEKKITISTDDVRVVRDWLKVIDDQIKTARQLGDIERVESLLSRRTLADELMDIYRDELGEHFPY